MEVKSFVHEALTHYCVEVVVKDFRKFNFILKDLKAYDKCQSLMNIIRNYAFLDRLDERNVLSYAFCFDFYKSLTV